MWQVSIPANYKNQDLQVMTVGTVQGSLPAPDTTKVPKPERIMVQAKTTNTASIFIGKTGVSATGSTGAIEFPPGTVGFLPSKNYADWKLISASASQLLFVTYMSGVD